MFVNDNVLVQIINSVDSQHQFRRRALPIYTCLYLVQNTIFGKMWFFRWSTQHAWQSISKRRLIVYQYLRMDPQRVLLWVSTPRGTARVGSQNPLCDVVNASPQKPRSSVNRLNPLKKKTVFACFLFRIQPRVLSAVFRECHSTSVHV